MTHLCLHCVFCTASCIAFCQLNAAPVIHHGGCFSLCSVLFRDSFMMFACQVLMGSPQSDLLTAAVLQILQISRSSAADGQVQVSARPKSDFKSLQVVAREEQVLQASQT